MKARQRVGKARIVQSPQDVDRSFAATPESALDGWRDNLDVFFDENEAGQDHMRRLIDVSKADIDHYDFAGGYDLSLVDLKRSESGGSRMPMTIIPRLGGVIPVYENTAGFRYALP